MFRFDFVELAFPARIQSHETLAEILTDNRAI